MDKIMDFDEMIKEYGIKSERILYEEDDCIGKLIFLNNGIGVIKEIKKRKRKRKESEDKDYEKENNRWTIKESN